MRLDKELLKRFGMWAVILWLYFPTGTPDDVIALWLMSTLGSLYLIVGIWLIVVAAIAVKNGLR